MSRRLLSLVFSLLVAVSAAACGDDNAGMRRNPAGPSNMGSGMGNGVGGTGMPGTGFGGPGMGNMSMMLASEFDYLAQMIPHHEEAIETATILKAKTNRTEMREFADTIIATQSAEVAQMKRWLAAWYPGRDTTVRYVPMMGDLTGLTGEGLDRVFLERMIPHHMMAVMMSQQLLGRSLVVHADVAPFAAGIRDTQQAEIRMMSQWLREWF